jgi:uncharacterized protein YcbK (DUF882 family)
MRGISISASILAVAVAFATTTLGSDAQADVQHTVAKGHTLEAIAARYHVTVKSIVEANKLKDPKHLKVGDVLTIPKVDAPKKPEGDKSKDPKAKLTKDGKPEHGSASSTFAAKAKTPGVIHLHRLATTEEQDVHVGSKISSQALKAMEKLLRSPSGASHPIEARLVSLLATVSNHFGSRKIEVVSGFRPYTPTQYNPHSNHNHGKAVDFRVVGVPNEAVRDFCRTLKNTGCGYYPNSVFVHMDVRETSAFWIDYSKPGETPRYNASDVDADEGTSDVHGDTSPSTNTPPPETPSEHVPTESDTSPSLNPDDDG